MATNATYARKEARKAAQEAGQSSYTTDGGTRIYDTATGKQRPTTSASVPTSDLALPPLKNEPSVLSSESGRQTYQQDVIPYIEKLNAIESRALQLKAEKDKVNATTEEKIPEDILYEGEDPLETVARKERESWERQRADAEAVYDDLKFSIDRSAQAQVGSLKNQWSERTRLLEESNRANEATWKQQFIRSGQAEYSPGMTNDFLTAKEREGARLIQDLDNQYNAAIAAVNTAAEEKKYTAAADLANTLRSIESKMLDQMRKNAEEAKKVNDEYRKRASLITKQSAIVDLYEKGITEPSQLLDYLNFTEDGKFIGDVSLEDIQDTIKMINSSADLTGASADLRTFSLLYPELKVGSPEFRDQYNKFVVTQASLKRKPTPDGSPETYLSFEEWKQTPAAQNILKVEDPTGVKSQINAASGLPDASDAILKPIYEETIKTAKRQAAVERGKNYTSANIPPDVRDDLVVDITSGADLQALFEAYPEVSSSYISSLANSLTSDEEDFDINALLGEE